MAEPPKRTVKDLLAESKDTSELMVDLAYAAVFFNDPKLADEVDHLEDALGSYVHDLQLASMLAARSPEDAVGMSAVLHIAACIEQIGDAALEVARVVSNVLGIPDALRADLRHADEVSGRVRVQQSSACVGRSLRDLELPTETGMWVIAVRRGNDWEFDPGPDTVVGESDVLLFRGPEEGVELIRDLAGAEQVPEPDVPGDDVVAYAELDRAVDILVAMTNTGETSVGLAYSALTLREPALAAEVTTLEARSDDLQSELESWVLRAAESAPNPEELRGLLRIARASEAICDAAREITRLVEHAEELHPVVAEAIEASDAMAAALVVDAGTAADGHTLGDLSFKTETGMTVLAVQRGGRWIYRPAAHFELRAGDRVIVTGPEDGIEEVEVLVRTAAPARSG